MSSVPDKNSAQVAPHAAARRVRDFLKVWKNVRGEDQVICRTGAATELYAGDLGEMLKDLESLSDALRPLASLGGPDDGSAAAFPDLEDNVVVFQNSGECITAGDVRVARKLASSYVQPKSAPSTGDTPAELIIACHQCAGKYWIKAENNWWWFEHLYRCPHCKAALKVAEPAAPSAIEPPYVTAYEGALDQLAKALEEAIAVDGPVGDTAPPVIKQYADQFKAMRGLLQAAKCPACDGSGAIPRQVSDWEWAAEQCQWCDERSQINFGSTDGGSHGS